MNYLLFRTLVYIYIYTTVLAVLINKTKFSNKTKFTLLSTIKLYNISLNDAFDMINWVIKILDQMIVS